MLLHRINPERNEARFYLVEVGPSLFDPYAVLRVWGRIGGAQQSKVTPCMSAAEAQKMAGQLIRRKLNRDYKPCASASPPGDKIEGETDESETEKSNPPI